jgi:hypothetical protein
MGEVKGVLHRVCVRVKIRGCGNSIISIKKGEGFRKGCILFNINNLRPI